MKLAYLQVDDKTGSWTCIGHSVNPDAWEWAKAQNKLMRNTDDVQYGCHCGIVELGQQVGDLGVITERVHTSECLMTVLVE